MSRLALLASLFVCAVARAENNGLVYDAQTKGYSFVVSDVRVGPVSMFDSRQAVRIVMRSVRKGGQPIAAVDWNGPNRDPAIVAQVNQICLEMFGTPSRLESYDVVGTDYSYFRTFDVIGCEITQKAGRAN